MANLKRKFKLNRDQWRTQKFSWSFIQWHMVVICSWCNGTSTITWPSPE